MEAEANQDTGWLAYQSADGTLLPYNEAMRERALRDKSMRVVRVTTDPETGKQRVIRGRAVEAEEAKYAHVPESLAGMNRAQLIEYARNKYKVQIADTMKLRDVLLLVQELEDEEKGVSPTPNLPDIDVEGSGEPEDLEGAGVIQ
ncbi:MAG: hypothetical protein AMXMBFR84_26060 [Candidatus Hydrogenedentota bacterium]